MANPYLNREERRQLLREKARVEYDVPRLGRRRLSVSCLRKWLRTPEEAELAIFEFIEGWYNPRHRHSASDYYSPIGYESKHLGVIQDTS